MFHRSFKDDYRKFQGSFHEVSWVFQGSVKGVSRMFNGVSRKIEGHLEVVCKEVSKILKRRLKMGEVGFHCVSWKFKEFSWKFEKC